MPIAADPAHIAPLTERTHTAAGFIDRPYAGQPAQRVLSFAAQAWCATALAGQFIFALYITVVYGGAVLSGDHARWNTIMRAAYVPGETLGNAAIAAHVLLAVLIMRDSTWCGFAKAAAAAWRSISPSH